MRIGWFTDVPRLSQCGLAGLLMCRTVSMRIGWFIDVPTTVSMRIGWFTDVPPTVSMRIGWFTDVPPLMHTTGFWDNIHQVRSKSKD